jgi:hypothetical protein
MLSPENQRPSGLEKPRLTSIAISSGTFEDKHLRNSICAVLDILKSALHFLNIVFIKWWPQYLAVGVRRQDNESQNGWRR